MLLKFLVRQKVALPPVERRLTLGQQLLQNLENTDSLPYLSDTIVKAMFLMNNPDTTIAEMADLIRRDSLLATKLLKIANSPLYRTTSTEVTDLRTVVMTLGFSVCTNLLSSLGVRDVYSKHPPFVVETCDSILRHSLLTANLADNIRQVLKLTGVNEAFVGGLLHDMGRIVLCVKAPDQYEQAFLPDFEEFENVCDLERSAFGTDHTGLGGIFAAQNQLPRSVGRVMINHHHPERESDYSTLVGLVAVADTLANRIQRRHNLKGFDITQARGWAEATRKATPEREALLIERLPTIAVSTLRQTRSMLKNMSQD